MFHRTCSAARARALPAALLALPLLCSGLSWPIAPALAQCVTSGNDVTCTNTGTQPDNAFNQAIATNGNATVTNSGSMGNNGSNFAFAFGAGNGNATVTNSGSMGNNGSNQASTFGNGNAATTNSGSMGNNGSNQTFANGSGNATTTNSGSMGNNANNQAFAIGNGNATVINSGSIGNNAFTQAFALGNGNAIVTNSGSIGNSALNEAFAIGNGNASFTNWGSIGNGSSNQAVALGTGNASFTNFGTVAGTVAVTAASGTATLSNFVGSRIIGSISLNGATRLLNFVGGNFLYTLNALSGVTINSNGAPFAVNGNSVAVLDPTALALEDRSVMNFTAGVSSMLQDRFIGMAVSGNAAGGAIGFAPGPAGRLDAAHDAFSGMPSVSMAYSTDARESNAKAMYTKAPALAAPLYDTVVWTSGFGGERRQWEDGPIQRARDDAYGGAIGIDRQVTPDLRLGAFAGGGNSRLKVAYDIQKVDSDYVFGGGYGRWDRHNYYVDFALFGGGLSSRSTRQIANNNVASGLETATASYNGWFFSPDITYGYRLFMGDYTITPKARLRYVGGTLDGYTETGSAQGLTMGKRTLSDIEERLGVEFASIRQVSFGGTLKTSVDVSGLGLQRLGDNTINAVLLAQNIAFTTPGRSEAFGGVVNLGLDWRPKSNLSLFTSVEATAMSDKSFSATGKGGVRVSF
jgi:outer membrane autotransporter protein